MKRLFVGCAVRFVDPGHPWNGHTGLIVGGQRHYDHLLSVKYGTIGAGYGWRLTMDRHDGDFIAPSDVLEPAAPDKSKIRETESELDPA
jgi:hypothetical protein